MTPVSPERALRSSFRDPAGFVFKAEGVILRQVNDVYRSNYDRLMGSGLYDALTERGLLVPHSELAPSSQHGAAAYKILRPEPLPFVSYPYEWCFGQLKDAALTTLTIQRAAVEHGMSLKDASAYNIQFIGSRPVHIDTLSFEIDADGRPWTGYRQFCQQFLAPLALMSTVDVQHGQLSRVHIDGVPLSLASRTLPWRTRLRPSLLLHLHLHARAQHRFRDRPTDRKRARMGRRGMLGLIDHLRSAVEGLTWNPVDTAWSEYDQHTNYSNDAREHKERLVEQFLGATHPRMVWDLGANHGRFGRMAARMGAHVVCLDADYSAIESNYRVGRSGGDNRVLPLVVDLANPSPASGWAHEERLALIERGPADTVLALALVHHLAVGNNVPLDRIAECLSRMGRHLIIEFVPKTDSQVQRLLAHREDVFADYTQNGFERAFAAHFRIRHAESIGGSHRVLYLMERG